MKKQTPIAASVPTAFSAAQAQHIAQAAQAAMSLENDAQNATHQSPSTRVNANGAKVVSTPRIMRYRSF